jgi:hypothetical protein
MTSSMSRISFSEQAPSVTKANSAILGGYISSTLAAIKRHVIPVTKDKTPSNQT